MFSYEDYVGVHKDSADLTDARKKNIEKLLVACSNLEKDMIVVGIKFPVNPKIGTQISGETFGGFRPQSCKIGAPKSAHKEGLAVDRYDPDGQIDSWLMSNPQKLKEHGIYIEHPLKTVGWSHWSIKPPLSGRHIFYP